MEIPFVIIKNWAQRPLENEDFEQPDYVSTEIPLFGTNLVSNSELNMLYTTSLQILCRKGISMLTGLKVSSLACKCVFYRPEYMDFSFSFYHLPYLLPEFWSLKC